MVVGTLLVLSPRRRETIAIDGSLLLISMLMLSPMTSRSHYVALLLPYMTLVTLGFRDDRTLNLGRAVLAASFLLVTLTSNDIVGQDVTEWAYGHSHLVLGTLVLLIYFAVLVIRLYRGDRGEDSRADARRSNSADCLNVPLTAARRFHLALGAAAASFAQRQQHQRSSATSRPNSRGPCQRNQGCTHRIAR